ncbi:hypothetical protein AV274_2913 [Blastocystis sp. ATCC 50177/Nand II]|uniref:Transmembrane protein n=1 Tax=Blastocystis sp. subtype 1 (strain ATCC 50177 / NandII) TaxID=478820 RepID=A0A196SHE3_BLAHN|nr:hypothetical protein AV274_2913 [Blastocystis sp. ATCC 50177/Nand II]
MDPPVVIESNGQNPATETVSPAIAIPVVTSIPMETVVNSQPVPIPSNIEREVIQEAYVVGKVVDCSQPPELAESIAIPPDPECGNAVADSFESMCIDVEPEVQLDLVEVISEMKCQRILSLIIAIALFVCTIGFLVVRKFGAGVACFGLFLVEVLCWLFSYYYSRSLMLTCYILLCVGYVDIAVYLVLFVREVFIESGIDDICMMGVILVYVVASLFQVFGVMRIRRVLVNIPPSQRDLIPFMERENRKSIKPKFMNRD